MKSDSYSRLLKNRKRINEKNLIVGADIGNGFNAIGLMVQKETVLGKCPKVYNSRRGFEFFRKNIKHVMEQRDCKRCFWDWNLPDITGGNWPIIA